MISKWHLNIEFRLVFKGKIVPVKHGWYVKIVRKRLNEWLMKETLSLWMNKVLKCIKCIDEINVYTNNSLLYFVNRSRTILDDFREAYFWLRQNTDDQARVMSWWDYGYQIAGMGNKTTLVDNNTWNNSHIALVILQLVIRRIKNVIKKKGYALLLTF